MRRRQHRMYTHISECLHDFYEASSQCSAGAVEINSMISKNWSATTWISVSTGQRAWRRPRRRCTMHPHALEHLLNFYESPTQFYNAVVEIIWRHCSIIIWILVCTGQRAWSSPQHWQTIHPHVPESYTIFMRPFGEGYYSIIEIWWFIEETWCITTCTIFCRPLVKVTVVLFKLNHLLKKLGV